MKIEEYREYLQMQGFSGDKIEKQTTLIGDFERFLADLDMKKINAAVETEEAEKFSRKLIAEGRNTLEHFTLLSDYACHCPLLRDAILRDQPLSPDVCQCSLGYASHSLAGLGLELKGEVLESAVKGDTRCRFVFHLPDKDKNT